ncbi:MAG TPA: helix-turn-helix transcriptional regulator [Streptosporangiaceae bacterium]|nr:helix-turn-helix transcriptional regulator [Streptosporangiaceae bacterium]
MTSTRQAATEAAPTILAQRWTTVLDGQRLRELRSQRGLSQGELANRAEVSPATVARLERRAPCRTRTLARLAAVLGEHPSAIAPALDPNPGVVAAL